MINKDRIVPIQRVDYLTLLGTIANFIQAPIDPLAADDVEGNFTVSADGAYLANQPVKSLNFTADASDASVVFVADYNYEGFLVAGTAVETTGDEVLPDGITTYVAALSSGDVTIACLTPMAQ